MLWRRSRLRRTIQEGRKKEEAGKWAQAAAVYKEALRSFRSSAELYFRLGFVMERRALVKQAMRSYRSALALEPSLAKAHYRLGFLFEKQKDNEAAIAAYRKALEHNPCEAEWHYRLGRALTNLARFEDAITSFEAALAQNPGHAETEAALQEARYRQAWEQLDLAAVQRPPSASPHNLAPQALEAYCSLLYLEGRPEEALELLEQRPFAPRTKLLEAKIYQYLGDLNAAERCFGLVANGRQSKVAALANLAHIYWLRGQRERAITLLARVIRTYPRSLRPITLFGRFAQHPEEVEHLIDELRLQSRANVPPRNYAQLVRACIQPEATEAAYYLAEAAAIRLARLRGKSAAGLKKDNYTGLPKSAFSAPRGLVALKDLAEVGRRNGIRFFPMGGTLLGHIRDGAPITWDKDLDVGCFADEATSSDIHRALQEHPHFLVESNFGHDHDSVKVKHFSGTPIDILINVRNADRVTHCGQVITWYNSPFELRDAEVMGASLYLPEDAEKYLEEHYGSEWRTPDPHFDVFYESPCIHSINPNRIFFYAIAKAIDLIGTGAEEVLALRVERAKKAHAPSELIEGFSLVRDLYERYSRRL